MLVGLSIFAAGFQQLTSAISVGGIGTTATALWLWKISSHIPGKVDASGLCCIIVRCTGQLKRREGTNERMSFALMSFECINLNYSYRVTKMRTRTCLYQHVLTQFPFGLSYTWRNRPSIDGVRQWVSIAKLSAQWPTPGRGQ